MMLQDLGTVALITSQIVIYMLILLSVLSISLIIERLIWFARRRVDVGALSRDLLDKLSRGDAEGARQLVEGKRSIETKVVVDILPWYDAGPEALSQA